MKQRDQQPLDDHVLPDDHRAHTLSNPRDELSDSRKLLAANGGFSRHANSQMRQEDSSVANQNQSPASIPPRISASLVGPTSSDLIFGWPDPEHHYNQRRSWVRCIIDRLLHAGTFSIPIRID